MSAATPFHTPLPYVPATLRPIQLQAELDDLRATRSVDRVNAKMAYSLKTREQAAARLARLGELEDELGEHL